MEGETPLRRSSRSRSRTPSNLTISQSDGERLQGMREATVRIESFQSIREVAMEANEEVILTSSSSRIVVSNRDVGLNNNLSLEAHQNALNLSQEGLKKKKSTKTAENKTRSATKATKKAIVNGSTSTKKKQKKIEVEMSESSQEESVELSTPKTKSRTRSSKTVSNSFVPGPEGYMTTKASPKASPQARKLHESAMSGNYDVESSVFLKFYKNVGEWWNYYKKTDYTYSPLSRQRYELAPGVYNMPNLSRPAIGAYVSSISSVTRQQQNFNYLLDREDSDTEEFVDPRRWRYQERQEADQRQFGLLRKIYTFLYTCLVVLYTYTIGVVVTGVSTVVSKVKSAFSSRSTNGVNSSYYYYKETHTVISDSETEERAKGLTERLSFLLAWLSRSVARNWGKLLALLLLLLLAYSVYTGDFHKIKGDLSEKVAKLNYNLSDNFFEMTESAKSASIAYYQVIWEKFNETNFDFDWSAWLPYYFANATTDSAIEPDDQIAIETSEPSITLEEPVVA